MRGGRALLRYARWDVLPAGAVTDAESKDCAGWPGASRRTEARQGRVHARPGPERRSQRRGGGPSCGGATAALHSEKVPEKSAECAGGQMLQKIRGVSPTQLLLFANSAAYRRREGVLPRTAAANSGGDSKRQRDTRGVAEGSLFEGVGC